MHDEQSDSGVGVSTSCRAVSTGWTVVYVSGLLEWSTYGSISDEGKGLYSPGVLVLRISG